MVTRLHRPRFYSVEVMPKFILWSENPADTWLHLPQFFADELPAAGPGGLWLQADGCCSKASWVATEVSVVGNTALAHGWQTFARVRGLAGGVPSTSSMTAMRPSSCGYLGKMVARSGAALWTTTATRCSALETVFTRLKVALSSTLAVARPAMAAPPKATALAAAAMTNCLAAEPVLRVAAGRLVVVLR